MATFAITFTVVPVGSSPDTPGLERRTVDFTFDDPAYGRPEGQDHAYGPPFEVMEAAVNESLTPDAVGIIQSVEYAHALA